MELKLSCYLSHHAVVFKTKVSHFKVKNTPLKDTKMEILWKVLKNVQFPFCGLRKAFGQEIVH